jgi:type IV pilus assembly protein PilE
MDRRRRIPRDAHWVRGFTLIELVITVAVVAILTMIALPSYQEYVRRSTRSEAQAYLLNVATRQQQFLLDTRSYSGTLAALGVPVSDRVNNGYTLTLNVVAGPPATFTITAAPKGGQASEKCGTLTINQAGTRTAATSGCW